MYRTILVPTDGSDPARAALDRAVDLARTYDANIHVLYVVDVGDVGLLTPSDAPAEGVRNSLRRTAERIVADAVSVAEEAGVPAESTVTIGIPHVEILDAADELDVDLVVVGTHGRTGLTRALIGSVAERVVRRCSAPVLTVRADAE